MRRNNIHVKKQESWFLTINKQINDFQSCPVFIIQVIKTRAHAWAQSMLKTPWSFTGHHFLRILLLSLLLPITPSLPS